jgi:hypothetical protein
MSMYPTLPACFKPDEATADALTRVLHKQDVIPGPFIKAVEAGLVHFVPADEGGYNVVLTEWGIEALTRVGAFDICAECGEERHALIHTDTELHPGDAVDGLYLHPFGG